MAETSNSELREWAQQEAAKAPPFRPEQLRIITATFRLPLEKGITDGPE